MLGLVCVFLGHWSEGYVLRSIQKKIDSRTCEIQQTVVKEGIKKLGGTAPLLKKSGAQNTSSPPTPTLSLPSSSSFRTPPAPLPIVEALGTLTLSPSTLGLGLKLSRLLLRATIAAADTTELVLDTTGGITPLGTRPIPIPLYGLGAPGRGMPLGASGAVL